MVKTILLGAMVVALVGCTARQPSTMNSGPLHVSTCLVWCTTSIINDQNASSSESGDGGDISNEVSETTDAGELALDAGAI